MRKLFKRLSSFKKDDEAIEEVSEIDDEYYEDIEGEGDEDNEDEEMEDEEEQKWIEESDYEEGQLSIDVFQTPDSIVVKSTIAGVKPDDIDISINNDMLTIRGKREMSEVIKSDDYLFRECYWGSFSRSIILPVEVEADKIDADLENGVLTVTLPKAKSAKEITIKVKGKN